MTTRSLLLSLLILLTTACGGGGGGAAPAPGTPDPDPDPDPTPQEKAIEVLEVCGPRLVSALRVYMEVTEMVLSGAQGVQVVGASADPESVDLIVDLDTDFAPDATTAIRFQDDLGAPVDLGWTEEQTAAMLDPMTGLQAMLDRFAELDGVTMVMLTTVTGDDPITGELRIDFVGGSETTASGSLDADDGTCRTLFTITDQSYAGLIPAFPSASVDVTITRDPDTLAGTIVMNGTALAQASLALNGGATFTYQMNLSTGEVIEVP